MWFQCFIGEKSLLSGFRFFFAATTRISASKCLSHRTHAHWTIIIDGWVLDMEEAEEEEEVESDGEKKSNGIFFRIKNIGRGRSVAVAASMLCDNNICDMSAHTHSPRQNINCFWSFGRDFPFSVFEAPRSTIWNRRLWWIQYQCELGFDFDVPLMPFRETWMASIAFYWHIFMMISVLDCKRWHRELQRWMWSMIREANEGEDEEAKIETMAVLTLENLRALIALSHWLSSLSLSHPLSVFSTFSSPVYLPLSSRSHFLW